MNTKSQETYEEKARQTGVIHTEATNELRNYNLSANNKSKNT